MGIVLLVGNGVSLGLDERLSTAAITSRVVERLGDAYSSLLGALSQLAYGDDPDASPLGVERSGFEQLAGPLDRLADALISIEALLKAAGTASLLNDLRTASQELRDNFMRIVGAVLAEVDACCVQESTDEDRKQRWHALNEFARAIVELRPTVFTLNYDSLLMSAMLEATQWVYDGFRGGTLNVPLDPWSNPTLYSLHGSVSWVRTWDGELIKVPLSRLREDGYLTDWAAGSWEKGSPSVLLGDQKYKLARRFPFAVFYEELKKRLSEATLVVAGGYSFGDRPVNRLLAEYLASRQDARLIVWNPHGNSTLYLERLRRYVADGASISPSQVDLRHIHLPHAEAVTCLANDVPPA